MNENTTQLEKIREIGKNLFKGDVITYMTFRNHIEEKEEDMEYDGW